MDFNPYSDLSWKVQAIYQSDYFSEYERSKWILDCLAYECISMNSISFEWYRELFMN